MKIESRIGKAHNLQPPAPAIVKLLNLISDPEADFGEAIATIERDRLLTAKLLAICNTTRYGSAPPLGSVKQCVFCLGYTKIHRLILSLGFGHQLGDSLPAYNMAAGTLWQHSLTTAMLTPRILSLANITETDTAIAYTAGLVHDIGKLMIAQLMDTDTKNHHFELMRKEGKTLLEAEVATLGIDHAQIGAELLATWRFPDTIVTAVRYHHEPGKARNSSAAAAVHLANTVVHQVSTSPGWCTQAFTFDQTALTTLGLKVDDLEKFTCLARDLEASVKQENSGKATKAGPRAAALNL